MSCAVYYFASQEEWETFTTQFASDANKLLTNIGRNFDATMGAADAFMHQVVSQRNNNNNDNNDNSVKWPMIIRIGRQ